MTELVVAGIVITVAGVWLAQVVDRLADRTGWGEAVMGGLFLAGVTSIPDFAATLSAAVDGFADLAMSNVLGSIAANLVFLVVGDMVYRHANLEHAAASQANLTQATLSMVMLTLPLLAMSIPAVQFAGVHPVTPAILAAYLFGYRVVRSSHDAPMWLPRFTRQTIEDRPDETARADESLAWLWVKFVGIAAVVAFAGWTLMDGAEELVQRTGLSESAVGAAITGVVTSLPELVTTIAAIRLGALTLAVSNILGTNCFNVVVVAAADIAYREGSIYHAIGWQTQVLALTAILMTGVLLLGFLYRERFGFARIGSESALVLALYLGAIAVIVAH